MNNDQVQSLIGIGFVVVALIASILFCLTLFRTMQLVPKKKRQFPSYFVWLCLVPFVGIIFEWLMLPFGIPNSIRHTAPDNKTLVKRTKTLFGIGLAQVILITFVAASHIIPLHIPDLVYVNQAGHTSISISRSAWGAASVAGVVLWIIYWVKVVSIKNEFLAPSAR